MTRRGFRTHRRRTARHSQDELVVTGRKRLVRSRSVAFFADLNQVPEVIRRIDDEVVPHFSAIPGFVGFAALQSEGSRPEIVAMSFWNEQGVELSEPIAARFRDEVERVTGAAPAAKEFTVVKLVMRSTPDVEVGHII
ncbi:MAG: hypothetical protein ACLP6E_13795 [Acidimicrobiales bacterium]